MSEDKQNNTARDIYADPKLEEAKLNDPLYDMIKEHWRQFATILLASLAVIYFVQSFQESYESSMQASADLFQRLQTGYKTYQTSSEELKKLTAGTQDPAKSENAEKINELTKKVAESKSQVEQLINSASDAREPYKNFAQLYKAYLNKESSASLSKEILKPVSDWKNDSKPGTAGRLNAELAALQLGKIELESADTRNNGLSILTDLAINGEYAAVNAAKVLVTAAQNPEEKQQAQTTVKKLLDKHPEQSDLLNDIAN